MLPSITLLFLLLPYLSQSVDRNNFKTCAQSGFCKRLRGMEQDKSPYFTSTPSQLNSSSVTFDIRHETQSDVLVAVIRVLEDNSVRITAQEKDPVRPRYSPVDSLGEKPLVDGRVDLSHSTSSSTLSFPPHKIVINHNPLRVDVFTNNRLVTTLNARGLFQIETQKLKPSLFARATQKLSDLGSSVLKAGSKILDTFSSGSDAVEETPPQEGEEEEDLGLEDVMMMEWEEDFKSHTDTNPRGPRAISLDVSFTGFDKVYGLPEHADTFPLKSTKDTDPYRLYNLDVFEYELHNPMALYGSIPYLYALSPDQSVGMMWLNAAETWVDISFSNDKSLVGRVLSSLLSSDDVSSVDTHWMSESGLMDIFLFLGPSPKDVSRQYSNVFGPSLLPPMFSIAYHQCRWNYNDQDDVLGVDDNFDKHDIPVDVIWLDIEHTNGKRYFSWDGNKFGDSKGMLDSLARKGRNMVTIIDPHIKTDAAWDLYKEGRDHGSCPIFVKDRDGKNYEGHCWPGTSSWVDYTSPCAREWWAQQFSFDKYRGSTPSLYTWNDMNEPSVFNGPEVTMHKDAQHADGWEHRDVHNMYGFYMHSASRDGHLHRSGGKHRPFVLSRAFFVGSHRVGPIWTGDNRATWDHLSMSIPMLLSLNIAGYPFVGADTGGFFGNPETELLVRWYQSAIFTPFFRAHAHIDTRRREPWLFGEENTKLIRSAIIMRYQIIPYLYTQFYQASIDNTPIMRPLWFDNPSDTTLYSNEAEFMLGDSLLSSPVLVASESTHTVTLPGSEVWYDYHTHTQLSPGVVSIPVTMASMPLYIKGGSIIPVKMRVRRSSNLTEKDPYTIIVALNSQGSAAGHIYMDDGKTFDYQNNHFSYKSLTFSLNTLTCESPAGRDGGGGFTSAGVERIVVLGVERAMSASSGGQVLSTSFDSTSKTLTIKKPNVILSEDWTIQFS